jgi:hypothetical protein
MRVGWWYITNDDEWTPAYVLEQISVEKLMYTFFYTLDMLGRPTPRVAAYPSGIVQSEMGGLLMFGRKRATI